MYHWNDGLSTYHQPLSPHNLSDHPSVRISLANRACLSLSQTYDAWGASYHTTSNWYSKLLLRPIIDSITPSTRQTALSCGGGTRSTRQSTNPNAKTRRKKRPDQRWRRSTLHSFGNRALHCAIK